MFSDWGFSWGGWWDNRRGEWWLLAQLLLIAAHLLPVWPAPASWGLVSWPRSLFGVGLFLLALGLVRAIQALFCLGSSLSPLSLISLQLRQEILSWFSIAHRASSPEQGIRSGLSASKRQANRRRSSMPSPVGPIARTPIVMCLAPALRFRRAATTLARLSPWVRAILLSWVRCGSVSSLNSPPGGAILGFTWIRVPTATPTVEPLAA